MPLGLVELSPIVQQASDNLVRITQKFDQGPADYVLGGETLPVYVPEKQE